MFKKSVHLIVLLVFLFNITGCLTIKIDKDSEPLVDFGTPIVGHFRNHDTVKGVLYTVLFITSIIGLVLFAPGPSDDDNQGSILPISNEICNWSMLGFGIGAANVFAASSIDTAVTYQLANRKIIDLNKIDWKYDPTGKETKYNSIVKYRQEQDIMKEQAAENARFEQYKGEIEIYRKKLLDKSITDDELALIERAEKFHEELKDELTYYKISMGKKNQASDYNIENKNQSDEAKIEYYKQKLVDGTIPESELGIIENDPKLKDLLKNELGYFYVNQSLKKK